MVPKPILIFNGFAFKIALKSPMCCQKSWGWWSFSAVSAHLNCYAPKSAIAGFTYSQKSWERAFLSRKDRPHTLIQLPWDVLSLPPVKKITKLKTQQKKLLFHTALKCAPLPDNTDVKTRISKKHGVFVMMQTFSLSSKLELWPSPYSIAYWCHISASLLWRELTLPMSSFSLDRTVPACSPRLSVRFSTTARTRICKICRIYNSLSLKWKVRCLHRSKNLHLKLKNTILHSNRMCLKGENSKKKSNSVFLNMLTNLDNLKKDWIERSLAICLQDILPHLGRLPQFTRIWLYWASLTNCVKTQVFNICEGFHKATDVNGLLVLHCVANNSHWSCEVTIVCAPFSHNDSH